MPEISKIALPSGNTYDIKDATARQLIAGGVSFIVSWDGISTPVVANIPEGVVVKYNNTDYTGTMDADSSQAGSFYLVSNGSQNNDGYIEYIAIGTTGSKTWEKLGNLTIDLSALGALAYKDSVSLNKGSGDNVLGENTTFSVTNPTVSVSPTNKYMKASLTTNVAVGADGTATVLQVAGTPALNNVVGSISPTNKKLGVTTIVPTNGTDSATYVTGAEVKKISHTNVPNVTSVGTADTWNFKIGSGENADTLIIEGTNGTAPTLGTSIQAMTSLETPGAGESGVVLGTAVALKTLAVAGSSTAVATGQLVDDGTGGAVVSSLSQSNTQVVTGITSVGTSAALTGVQVTTQPVVTLSNDGTSSNGVKFIESATATATGGTVTAGTDDVIKVAKYSELSVSAT